MYWTKVADKMEHAFEDDTPELQADDSEHDHLLTPLEGSRGGRHKLMGAAGGGERDGNRAGLQMAGIQGFVQRVCLGWANPLRREAQGKGCCSSRTPCRRSFWRIMWFCTACESRCPSSRYVIALCGYAGEVGGREKGGGGDPPCASRCPSANGVCIGGGGQEGWCDQPMQPTALQPTCGASMLWG